MTTVDWLVLGWVSTLVLGASCWGWWLLWRITRQAMHGWQKAETAVIALSGESHAAQLASYRGSAEAAIDRATAQTEEPAGDRQRLTAQIRPVGASG